MINTLHFFTMKKMKKILLLAFVLIGLSFFISETFATDYVGQVTKPVGDALGRIPSKVGNTAGGYIDGVVNDFLGGLGGNGKLPSGSFTLPDAKEFGSEIGENTSARSYALKVVNFVLSFLGLIAVIMIIYAGFMYITQGEEGKDKAKSIVLYSVVGILVVLVSFALVNTVIKNAPKGTDDRGTSFIESPVQVALQDRASPGVVLDNVIASYQEAPSGLFSRLQASLFDRDQSISVDRTNIASLIVIKGTDLIDTDEAVYVSLENAQKGLQFEFNALSEVDWNMGDGYEHSTAPEKVFEYSYGSPGIYPVIAIGYNALGQRILQAKAVVVGAQFAQFSASQNKAPLGREIILDGRYSDVTGVAGNITSYDWSCSGGRGCFPDTSGERIGVSFATPGVYTIVLRIKTSTGLEDAVAQNIQITASEPFSFFDASPDLESDKVGNYVFDASESRGTLGQSDGLQYRWTIEGEEYVTQQPVFEYLFAEKKDYLVKLLVEEERPGQYFESSVFEKTITVTDLLSANFDIETEKAFVGKSIGFKNTSRGAYRFLWDFGDGETSRKEHPEHIYTSAGDKVIRLSVQSATEKRTIEKVVSVYNEEKPTAFLQIWVDEVLRSEERVSVQKGESLRFDARTLDAYGTEKPFRETWYVNGKRVEKKEDIPAIISDFGTYVLRLVAVHPTIPDQKDEQVRHITVRNNPPVVTSARVDYQRDLPAGSVKMKVEASDPEGEDLHYIYKAFFEGEEEVVQSGKLPETILTLKNGTYSFSVEVSDQQGNTTQYDLEQPLFISGVLNAIPEADFVIDPADYHYTTTDFSFEAQAKDANDDVLLYTWLIDGEEKQSGKNPVLRSILFPKPGEYTVSLQVDDRRGGVLEVSKNIRIQWDPNVKTAESNTPPKTNICIDGGNTVVIGDEVTFWSQATDINNDMLSYQWGVGAQHRYATTQNIKHVFDTLGKHSVSVQVSDAFAKTQDTVSVQVVSRGTLLPTDASHGCIDNKSLWFDGFRQRFQKLVRILPSQFTDSFLSQIGWDVPVGEIPSQEDTTNIESLDRLQLLGFSDSVDLERLLLSREQSLRRLLVKVKNPKIQSKIQQEIDLLYSDPARAAKRYLSSLRVEDEIISPTLVTRVGSTVLVRSEVPEGFEIPLLFQWENGNGKTLYGQSVSLSYDKPGYYLVSLLIRDELTEIQDWIIIQVDK